MNDAKTTGRIGVVGLVAGPCLALALLVFADLSPGHPEVACTAAVALWMAVWWMTEALPLEATALLPMVLFPALGVMDGKRVAQEYFNDIIFLFVGGFLVALAMQRWNLHRRIALRFLLAFGARPRRILAGFMAATAFLSMWISNTATTMMMVPIALAIILNLEETLGRPKVSRYAVGAFLAIAYSASIGGIATPVGTPPNLVLLRMLSVYFPAAPAISFAQWTLFALPLSLLFLFLAWVYLSLAYAPRKETFSVEREVFARQLRRLGPMSWPEKVVLADFTLLVVLWLSRADLELGRFTLPGWSRFFSAPDYLNDGVVAVALALVLFVVPTRSPEAARILDRDAIRRMPWNIVLLFGGGFALARGFETSGLSTWLGERLSPLSAGPPLVTVLAICLLVTFLTELTSNTATAQMLLPIMAGLSMAVGVHPLLFMIPAALSASFAFMLPVATPPNAIIFGTERVRIADMARAGLVLNLLGAVLITLAIHFWGRLVFDMGAAGLPDWPVR
ncbi:SLC13/DASS family transporter [bacterium]|nr:SLC13/DASS family transporter [bacterium]